MKPFYSRIGAKTRLLKDILPLIPPHKIYVEVFLGGGSVFWAKEPSEVEVLNDLDTGLIRDWKLIKGGAKPTLKEIQALYDTPPRTQKDKLLHAIIQRNNGFSGRAVVNKVSRDTNPYTKLDLLPEYRKRLKGVRLLSKDYKEILQKYDSPDTFFYLDPPYENSKGLYKEFSMDFEELERNLRNLKGYWMLSINDSPYIRKVFKGYKMKKIHLKAIANSPIGVARNELIIMNY